MLSEGSTASNCAAQRALSLPCGARKRRVCGLAPPRVTLLLRCAECWSFGPAHLDPSHMRLHRPAPRCRSSWGSAATSIWATPGRAPRCGRLRRQAHSPIWHAAAAPGDSQLEPAPRALTREGPPRPVYCRTSQKTCKRVHDCSPAAQLHAVCPKRCVHLCSSDQIHASLSRTISAGEGGCALQLLESCSTLQPPRHDAASPPSFPPATSLRALLLRAFRASGHPIFQPRACALLRATPLAKLASTAASTSDSCHQQLRP